MFGTLSPRGDEKVSENRESPTSSQHQSDQEWRIEFMESRFTTIRHIPCDARCNWVSRDGPFGDKYLCSRCNKEPPKEIADRCDKLDEVSIYFGIAKIG